MITPELRQEAGKFDKSLDRLFEMYVSEEARKTQAFSLRDITDLIDLTLMHMSTKVSPECYQAYTQVYESLKEEYSS